MTTGRKLAIATATVVALLGLASSSEAAEFKLVCAHDQPAIVGSEGQREIAWQKFKKEVEARTNGRVEVQVIGGAQLGDMPQILQNMRLGTVDCASIDASTSGPFIPTYAFAGAPYLIESPKHAALLVDPDRRFFKEASALVQASIGAIAIGSELYPNRNVYNSKHPIKVPEDLAGLKLRTMQSPLQVKAWQALGASPTPVAFSEVYSALQSGVIDGAENQPSLLWSMKHYEAIKYYSLTNHMINVGVLTISNRAMNKLPAELRPAILAAGRLAGEAGIAHDREQDAASLIRIKGAGVVVNEVDVRPFIAKLAPLHDALAKEFKAEELLKIIREEAAVARGT